jgi:hypothetical protein
MYHVLSLLTAQCHQARFWRCGSLTGASVHKLVENGIDSCSPMVDSLSCFDCQAKTTELGVLFCDVARIKLGRHVGISQLPLADSPIASHLLDRPVLPRLSSFKLETARWILELACSKLETTLHWETRVIPRIEKPNL